MCSAGLCEDEDKKTGMERRGDITSWVYPRWREIFIDSHCGILGGKEATHIYHNILRWSLQYCY